MAAIRTTQTHGDDREALAHIALAERLAAPPPARLVITHGLSGCGKTVASNALLQNDVHASTIRVRSDVERKRLHGLAVTPRSGSAIDAGMYAADAHLHTYTHLHGLAGMLLRAGWSVVVDATFLKRADRDDFRVLAQTVGVAFRILAPQAIAAQLRERVQTRSAVGADASEATLEVLEQQRRILEPLGPDESRVPA